MGKPMSPVRLRLAEVLRERKITQKQLAEMTGLSENSIGNLIKNPRQIRFDSIDLICSALKIEPGDLIVREDK